MATPIEILKLRVRIAAQRMEERLKKQNRTPKRMAHLKEYQAKGAKARIGMTCSEDHKEAIRQGQYRRREREKANKNLPEV
jgi:hypothetical protein